MIFKNSSLIYRGGNKKNKALETISNSFFMQVSYLYNADSWSLIAFSTKYPISFTGFYKLSILLFTCFSIIDTFSYNPRHISVQCNKTKMFKIDCLMTHSLYHDKILKKHLTGISIKFFWQVSQFHITVKLFLAIGRILSSLWQYWGVNLKKTIFETFFFYPFK